MALGGYDWLIVVAVLLVIFLWGPQKLPELARSIGLAKKEFDKAAKEISTPGTSVSSQTSQTTDTATDPLLVAAKSLGITTEGKTKEEIAKEIADRSVKK